MTSPDTVEAGHGAGRGRTRSILILLLCAALGGCFRLGPDRLNEDQLGYSSALSAAEKRQTLLNVMRLRYGDAPAFLDATQVISGYQLQRSVTGGFEVFPNAPLSTYLTGTGAAQLQESPTFTFQPVTGDRFAQGFLRPLSPVDLLPLAQGGLPIDVLFRLAVQSVGPLQNSTGLEQAGGAGSPAFFLLLHDLRQIQIAGLISIRLEQTKITGPDGKPANGPERVYFDLASTSDPALVPVAEEAHRLLGLPPNSAEGEIVYGRSSRKQGQIALLTRSMLGVLAQLAFQAQVPVEDVARHRTVPTIGEVGMETRPVVIIRYADQRPSEPFTAIEYQNHWFWIDANDFDSKVAFTMVNILLALAQTSSSPGTVITIPAG